MNGLRTNILLDRARNPVHPQRAELDRTAIRQAYRMEEEQCVAERLRDAADSSARHHEAAAFAGRLIEGARAHKAAGLDAFLHSFGLGTEEGIALMCLAEALLRVPDNETRDALIADKLSDFDWAEHLGKSKSTFVNAATFSLMLTGEVLRGGKDQELGLYHALRRATGRLGEPVIRNATLQAMRILGGQFVFGRTIEEALSRAEPQTKQGLTHSFDMLGEAAMTFPDAARYREAYEHAIDALASKAGGVRHGPGISVKLSALYPRYEFRHREAAIAALVPIVKDLARRARDADIHFTVDAEEAERLELSLDIIEAVVADDDLFSSGWDGFGLAIQAYQKRGVPLCDWVGELARRHGRKLMVRLVKGAYWDTEIKLSQVGGYADYPVFTRKLATDVSFLACAARLLRYGDAVFPAFATHNAYTISAIKALAGDAGFEFQRLHGMGEEIYDELARLEKERGETPTRVRIYAPVGGHRDLLAYLVRRLLENGANSSFVNRMADADVPVQALVGDPVAELAALQPRRNPMIPLPLHIYPRRRNSAGVDLADPVVLEPLLKRLERLERRHWEAAPTAHAGAALEEEPILAPQDRSLVIGSVRNATRHDIHLAIERAEKAQPAWDKLGGAKRAELLVAASDLFEAHTDEFLSLCMREAGKTLPDAVLELREAVDFLRYYACEARMLFEAPLPLPGPTGEENRLRLHGRGVFATISPWNFPLAIFIGPTAAALAAGNCVIAKPAEQTPLIAALAIKLCHEAGIPADVLQLATGGGEVGAVLTSHPRIDGVAFTGSTATAHAINRSLAAREGPIGLLIAETGGQNAMIVDSSALPEQVTRDVVNSAFQSAGQRCSALRVLFLQEEIADAMLEMIRGAFDALEIGDPERLETDVGPVIDEDARVALEKHVDTMLSHGHRVWRKSVPESCRGGSYVAPTIIEIDGIEDLDDEHFGPVLHVCRYRAEQLGKVVEAINATRFGLTLGLHSRIDATRRFVEQHAKVGNLYVNRNQIGAVVGTQPFGGEGLSGTGPKAGGPNYVLRFATERVTTIDTTASGGNASLLAGG